MKKIEVKTLASSKELSNREKGNELFIQNPLPSNEQVNNAGLFVKRQELQKILFFNEIYKKLVNVHGNIMEFGVRWGQNLVTLSNLRGIYEPYNYNRKIVGFDTFEGFTDLDQKDGTHEIIKEGAFSVTENYEEYLHQVLEFHQNESPLNHIQKFELRKGNAIVQLEDYLKKHPETIIAFAYFDFDIYKPTRDCLELLKPHLTKGSIIGFDELNDKDFPGETLAVQEVLCLNNIRVERNQFSAMQSYYIFE